MEFLYFMESVRMPGLNELMLLVTKLGEETAFLVAAMVVFWCVDKKKGYYLMSIGFVTTMLNQFLKLVCRVPRPWIMDENFTILEQAREAAAGYSFPSGHSQSAVGTFGAIAYTTRVKWLKWLCIAVAVLVPFSRMYIGVHTPADVLAGAAISLLLVYLLRRPAMDPQGSGMKFLIGGMIVLSLGLLAYTEFYPFPVDVDAHNLQSGQKNAYTMIGCMAGIAIVYPAEQRLVNFDPKAVWWVQILKVVLGLALVLLVKEGTRTPLEWLFNGHLVARSVRYFLVVFTAGLLWPMSFSRISRIGVRK